MPTSLAKWLSDTEGQDAEGFVATHQCRRARTQGAVTAAEDDHVRVRGGRLPYGCGKALVADREDFRFQVGALERFPHA